MAAATSTWLPSNLVFDRHLIRALREELSWKHQVMRDKRVQRVLEKRNAESQRLLYSYLELRTGGLPPFPPVLSGTAIKCILSHSDVEDIYLATGAEGNLSDFASNICAAPPSEFIALLESLASSPFDDASPRAHRVTRRAMEILTYRDFSWSRKVTQPTSHPDSLLEPFSTLLLLKKDVRQYAQSHKHFSSLLKPESAQYRSFATDVFRYALSIGLDPTEALACADEVIDHHRIIQFLSTLPKRRRKRRSAATKDAASRDTRVSRGRKRRAENDNPLQAADKKKRKLDSPGQLATAARVTPQAITPSQQQKINPPTASQIQVLASIEATPDDTSHKSYPTKERRALDASMEEKRLHKAEKRRLKEEKRLKKAERRLRKEEKRRHREEKLKRKEERRRRKEEKRQQMLARPSTQTVNAEESHHPPRKEEKTQPREEKTQRMLAQTSTPKPTGRTKANPQKSSKSPRNDSHQEEAPRSRTSITSTSFLPDHFDDGPSQQLLTEVKGPLWQAVKAEIGSSRLDSASDSDHPASMPSALTCTARKKRKRRETTSEYFLPPSASKQNRTSAIPVPPLSAHCFGLIQEELADEPFALLVAVKLLNKTRGHFADRSHPLSARNTFTRLMDCYPTPESLANAKAEDVAAAIHHLGLQNKRAKTLIAMAAAWVRAPPRRGVRYPTPGYPTHIHGAGKQIISANSKSTYIDDESVDPRIGAFEIAHLPGIGPYALDSWRIFCRDVLRGLATSYNGEGRRRIGSRSRSNNDGFEPEWKRVRPADKELRAFLQWMWLREGWIWDPETGERCRASKKVTEEADCGKTLVEANTG